MKKIILTLSAAALWIACFAQGQGYPQGVYMSWEEILTQKPSQQLDLQVVKRSNGDIKMNGGNDYKLTTEDKNIKRSFLTKEMWAYSAGDTLFLNGRQFKVQTWYTNVISDGRYMIFRAGMSNIKNINKKQRSEAAIMGAMFGALGGAAAGAQMAMLRFLYVLDKENGEVIAIDDETLKNLLTVSPSLQDDDLATLNSIISQFAL